MSDLAMSPYQQILFHICHPTPPEQKTTIMKEPSYFYNILGQFLLAPDPNSTFFLGMRRNPDGYFHQSVLFPPITDSYYSLLKFEKPDDDLSLDCLAGRFSTWLNYIVVFPVQCNARVANAYFCSMTYIECSLRYVRSIMEQVKNNFISFSAGTPLKHL